MFHSETSRNIILRRKKNGLFQTKANAFAEHEDKG